MSVLVRPKAFISSVSLFTFKNIMFVKIRTLVTLKSKNKLRILRVNLIIVGLYSGLFLCKLTYSNSGGSGFVWYFYLLLLLGLHSVINIVVISLKR